MVGRCIRTDGTINQAMPQEAHWEVTEINRCPRSVESYTIWKASEFRSWMLFYSLPVLCHFLPPEYIHHLTLLVCAMHILLSDCIERSNLDDTEKMISIFYNISPLLYDNFICTYNMHSLIHIVQFVRLWGPPWVCSMFGFENMNGLLGHTYHGTRKILDQATFNIRLQKLLPRLLNELSSSEESAFAKAYIKKLLHPERENMLLVGEHIYAIGRISEKKYQMRRKWPAISAADIQLSRSYISAAGRFMINGVIFYSDFHTTEGKKNDKTCMYKNHEGNIDFGVIKCFCIPTQAPPFCIVVTYRKASCTPITGIHPSQHIRFNVARYLKQYAIGVTKLSLSSTIVAVPISSVMKKCVLIPQKGQPVDYIVPLPNNFEEH